MYGVTARLVLPFVGCQICVNLKVGKAFELYGSCGNFKALPAVLGNHTNRGKDIMPSAAKHFKVGFGGFSRVGFIQNNFAPCDYGVGGKDILTGGSGIFGNCVSLGFCHTLDIAKDGFARLPLLIDVRGNNFLWRKSESF